MINVEGILKEFDAVKTKRAPWERMYDLISKYVLSRNQNFYGSETTVGDYDFYQPSDVFDNTAGEAHQAMVSSIDGALWKEDGRTFRIKKPRQASDRAEVKRFYDEINSRAVEHIEHEKAGFTTARLEAMTEVGAFGTDAIGVFRSTGDVRNKLEFKAFALKKLYVCTDIKGQVYKMFYREDFKAQQLLKEYGPSVLEVGKVKQAIEAHNYTTTFEVLWVLRPSQNENPQIRAKFPIESIHILKETKGVLRESGYSSLPVIVSRFYRRDGEDYGRSPAFQALPAIVQLNACMEMLEKGGELTIFPPWYVLSDGEFGNGVLDRSPNAVNSLDTTGSRITGSNPIGAISSVGDMNPILKVMEILEAQIKRHFLNDKLQDLNNHTRMTLGEAQIRNEMRSESNGSVFSRQLKEKYTPLIRRALDVLKEEGELGVVNGSRKWVEMTMAGETPLEIPQELVALQEKGIEIYQIEFISPAARILRSEEVRGVVSLWQFSAAFAQVKPELMLWLDEDKTMPLMRDLYGATPEALVSKEEYERRLEEYKQAQQSNFEMQASQVGADVAAKNASANQQNAQAEATRGGMNGLTNGGGGGGTNYMDMMI